MDAPTLASRLTEPSCWLGLLRGMFREGRATQAHAIYTSAQRRGVHDNHELRFTTYGPVGYAIMAFSVTGRLDPSTVATLTARAEGFRLGTLRREATAYNSLLPWGWHPHSYDPATHTIEAIGDPFPDVVVYVTATSAKGADRPLVVHAAVDGRNHIYPVPGDRLR